MPSQPPSEDVTPRPPASSDALAHSLAQLVWEGISADLADADMQALLAALGVSVEHGLPAGRPFEELLIFHLWVHTRSIQLTYRTGCEEACVRGLLDRMHGDVFEDMVDNGTPHRQLEGFERRLRARYVEYANAVDGSPERLGETVARHLAGTNRTLPPGAAGRLAVRAAETASPLRDYLSEIDLDALP